MEAFASRSVNRTVRSVLPGITLLVSVHGACASDPRALDDHAPLVTKSALLGEVTFTDERKNDGRPRCDEGDQAVFRQALILGRIVARSRAMRECVALAMRVGTVLADGYTDLGPYDPTRGDPYWNKVRERQIEAVYGVLLTPNPVHLTCSGHSTGGVTYRRDIHGYGHAERETVTVQNIPLSRLLDTQDLTHRARYKRDGEAPDIAFRERVRALAMSAGTLWHEVSHTHGYGHAKARHQSVPYIIDECLIDVVERSLQRCQMRSCRSPRSLALVSHYETERDGDCTCSADVVSPSESLLQSSYIPRLGTNEADDAFGQALAAGDFNGDGFDDLAVGLPGENSGQGRVHVFWGSVWGLYPAERIAPPRETPSLGETAKGSERDDERFGQALAAADFDDDGYVDLAVGSPGGNGQGRVYLFAGSHHAGLEYRTTLSLRDTERSDVVRGRDFGLALAAGPWLARGTPTLFVGAPGAAIDDLFDAGVVLVYQGTSRDKALVKPWGLLRKHEHTWNSGDRFGSSLAIGPLKTGRRAVLVGAPGDDQGKAYLFDGRSGHTNAPLGPGATLEPQSNARKFGQTVAIANGYVLVASLRVGQNHDRRWAAPPLPFPEHHSGEVFLFADLRSAFQGIRSLDVLASKTGEENFGHAIAALDKDFLISSPSPRGGRVYRYRLDAGTHDNQLETRTRSLSALASDANGYGETLTTGDFDADGHIDFAIGAPRAPNAEDRAAGAVYVQRAHEAGGFVPWHELDQES